MSNRLEDVLWDFYYFLYFIPALIGLIIFFSEYVYKDIDWDYTFDLLYRWINNECVSVILNNVILDNNNLSDDYKKELDMKINYFIENEDKLNNSCIEYVKKLKK